MDRKFSINKYDDKYIIRSLQKDILDFQEYTKDQIKRNKSVLDELIRLVQSAVNDCSTEYEVRFYIFKLSLGKTLRISRNKSLPAMV